MVWGGQLHVLYECCMYCPYVAWVVYVSLCMHHLLCKMVQPFQSNGRIIETLYGGATEVPMTHDSTLHVVVVPNG